jgi:heme/copper-type cytochrome/quinol oxidase subunit 4
VIVNFRTTYTDARTNNEIVDQKMIAKNYLKGRFWIDIFASLPFDQMVEPFLPGGGSSTVLQTLGILKLARLLRLSRLIAFLNLKDDVKISLKLFRVLFFIVLYIHVAGCMWFFIVKDNEEWIPPLDYLYLKTDLYVQSGIEQYAM